MDKMQQAIWLAHTLFERGHVTGSAANLSFIEKQTVFITASGTCFGTLTEDDFAQIDSKGAALTGKKPSKEAPLHLMLYNHLPETEIVLHTHSLYSTLWSCMEEGDPDKPWPAYTPYLQMRLGHIGRIPYRAPGSTELFRAAAEHLDGSKAYLLANHGLIIAQKDAMGAFCDLEEMESSAKTAWLLRDSGARTIC